MEELSDHLGCSPIELMMHHKQFKILVDRQLIVPRRKYVVFRKNGNLNYEVNQDVMDAIIDNRPFQIIIENDDKSPMEIITHLSEMIEERENENESEQKLWVFMKSYLNRQDENPLCKILLELNLESKNKMALIYCMARNIDNRSAPTVQEVSNALIQKKSDRRKFEMDIESKENELIKQNWLENKEEAFLSSSEMVVTEKNVNFFKPLEIDLRLDNKVSKIGLIKPDEIIKNPLFFNSEENKALIDLEESLKLRKHKQIQKALKNDGMRTGICTLYYGAPGTGKTESVYQIAKSTGRSVWKVDMSELKSMWYGQSQKLVKGLFTDYKKLCEDEKRTPILLLNEADAVLGKRSNGNNANTDKTENAIQNIFLDCLEEFEGILFATTNLEKSLDSAFERRFLFKLCFKRPDRSTQSKIWKTKIKGISGSLINGLTDNYNFSGGEIENIARKYRMAKILDPKINIETKLVEFCASEKLIMPTKVATIGFRK